MAKISEVLADGPVKEAVIKQFGADADAEVVAKSYIEVRDKLTSTRRVPDQSATREEWDAFHASMGRPPEANGYDLPADAPSSIRSILEALRPIAHQVGIPREAFSKLAAEAAGRASATERELQAARQEMEKRVRDANGDKADSILAQAQETLAKIMADDPKAKQVLEMGGLSMQNAMLQAILKVRSAVSDEKAPFGGTGPSAGPSAEKLAEKGLAIMGTEEFQKTNHPLHAVAARNLRQIQADLLGMGYNGINDPRLKPRLTLRLADGTVIG